MKKIIIAVILSTIIISLFSSCFLYRFQSDKFTGSFKVVWSGKKDAIGRIYEIQKSGAKKYGIELDEMWMNFLFTAVLTQKNINSLEGYSKVIFQDGKIKCLLKYSENYNKIIWYYKSKNEKWSKGVVLKKI